MLQLVDCIAFSGLTSEQLEAVAIHKHMPMVVACEWAECAEECTEGCLVIEGMIEEEVEIAVARGDLRQAERYRHGLEDFLRTHRGRTIVQ